MRMTLLVFLVACSGSEPALDAALPTVHDQLFSACDTAAWSAVGVGPKLCEFGCGVPPAARPCPPTGPCLSQPECQGAHNPRYSARVNCAATFTATDYMGDHRGCCVVLPVAGWPPIPTFYECP